MSYQEEGIIQVAISLTEDECDFILEFCNGVIGIDISRKLGIASINSSNSQVALKLTLAEVSRLTAVLRQQANSSTFAHTDSCDWAHSLADMLVAQWDEAVRCHH